MAKPFVPITLKMNFLILVSLTIGIGAVTVYLGFSLTRTIDTTTRDSLAQEADIVYQAIEQLMLPGEAPLVVDYFQGVAGIDPRYQVYLYRTDGTPAFSDNRTIADVNERLGSSDFPPRPAGVSESVAPPIEITPEFEGAAGVPARQVIFEERTAEAVVVRFFRPLINLPKCTVCHGPDHTVRGVLDLRTDISGSVNRQERAIYSSVGAFLILVAAVGLIMSRFVRHAFIAPLVEIGSACEAVTEGDFSRRSGVRNNDELGRLSQTVNRMIEGLYERFVLSRYVSSSTIASLAEEQGSRSETLTFLFSDIRGFTAFTEKNAPETVVNTLNRVLGDQTEIITKYSGDIDKYVGDEIVAVFSGPDAVTAAARAALEIAELFTSAEKDRYEALQVGIGINAGPVIVGEIGSRARADFTAVGDNVNVAARLCSGASPGEILVSDACAGALEKVHADLEGPYRMVVKGKAEALRVFKLRGIPAEVARQPESGEAAESEAAEREYDT
ncbi:MAG: adenylate/guanylate cyclase domain-containing protein [Alkalispirochaeta sp.]